MAHFGSAGTVRPYGHRTFRSLLVLLGLATMLLAFAAETPAAEAKYVGVKSCGKCHKKTKQGEQLAIWKKSKHAKAYQALGTPKAKERARKIGFNGDPQKSEACLICHTTGFGEPAARFGNKFKMKEGVQCEACHGPGSLYKKRKVMKKIRKERGPDKKSVSPTAKKTGLIFPDENTCKNCHVKQIERGGKIFKNPSYEPFDFKERFDKIKHPVPE